MRSIRPLASDALKFVVVGGVGFAVDITTFNLLRASILSDGTMPGAVLVAKCIATVAAICANWAGNRWWTFKDRRSHRVLAEALSFLAVSLTGGAITLACLAVSHYALGFATPVADNVSANVVGLILGSLFRFFATRHWVFSSRSRWIPAHSPTGT